MPCWYFERKEIKHSPSFNAGIDTVTESRYRREGARFIIDAGTKMGLRYDTCATGVIYFHRFYMFHSFKEYFRYVTAACCLLLAGKVEETPKKGKDIIRITQSILSAASFAHFGEDPREEVLAMERVLLKTIKFDFQVEHPYGCMLKYAKLFKGDKEKTQKMAQMAWTFINDSMCTTLCLQWEPEIIAVSLMYLASRLTKFEPSDWSGRQSSKSKWWEDIIEGMSMELMEDICHQVLDLYSSKQKKTAEVDSPPQSPAKGGQQASPPPPPPPDRTPSKRTRENTPSESERASKSSKTSGEVSQITTIQSKPSGKPPNPPVQQVTSAVPAVPPSDPYAGDNPATDRASSSRRTRDDDYAVFNPYVSSQMYSSSFMSLEGSQNIQSILAGTVQPPPASSSTSGALPPTSSSSALPPGVPLSSHADYQHHQHHIAPLPDMSSAGTVPQYTDSAQYGGGTSGYPSANQMVDTSTYNYPPPPQSSQYGSHPSLPPAANTSLPLPPHQGHHYPPSASAQGYDPYMTQTGGAYPSGPPLGYAAQNYASGSSYYPQQVNSGGTSVPNYPAHTYPTQGSSAQQNYSGVGTSNASGGHNRNRANFHRQKHNQRNDIPTLTDIKMTGRPEWGHQN